MATRSAATRFALVFAIVLAISFPQFSRAQEPQAITFQQLLDYIRLDVKEEKILAMLSTSPISFTLGEDQIAKLRAAGASARIVDAVQKPPTTPLSDQASDIRDFVVILDCSASMRDDAEPGVSKWSSAQKAAADLIRAIPDQRRLAFIIYGNDITKRCNSIEVIRGLKAIDENTKDDLILKIASLTPSADTPIGASLHLAGTMLIDTNQLAKVVVITDGMESCGGDPVAEAARLAALTHLQGGVDVIGFGLKPNEVAQVERIAKSGRGTFYNADSVKKLRESVMEVEQSISKPAKRATDESGLTALDRLLIKNLSDKSVEVRGAAAATIGKRKLMPATSALAELISNDLWDETHTVNGKMYVSEDGSKELALESLLEMDRKVAERAIISALHSKVNPVNCWACEQAEKYKVMAATDILAGLIISDSWKPDQRIGMTNYLGTDATKVRAAAALKALDGNKLEESLLKAAESPNGSIRAWATEKLSEMAADPN